ncbi:MAG: XRE family transcriptional regulator [Marinibacterium sp.]|nr:XRE family transcriptional regulator [Marinibacterium sp.]
MTSSFSTRLARHLRALRQSHGWTLEDLADRSAVSRATLSRIENLETSPSAEALSKLAAAFDMPTARLVQAGDAPYPAHVPPADQTYSLDPTTGQKQRILSPGADALGAEVTECDLPISARVDIDLTAQNAAHEFHLLLREGHLIVTLDGEEYRLDAGDTLRFQRAQALTLQTSHHSTARYLLVALR